MASKITFERTSSPWEIPAALRSLDHRLELDLERCDELAHLLRDLPLPAEEEEIKLPKIPPDSIGNFFLALVAICHQTSPPGKPVLEGLVQGNRRRGWDYLFARFQEAASASPDLVSPTYLAKISPEEVRRIFRDPEFGERLTDPTRRAHLLNNLGQVMLRRRWETAEDIYHFCGRRIHGASPNLLETLTNLQAYSDPLQKKSFYFLALMQTAHLWTYVDPESLGPPIDYHEVRGHLRIGTVRIKEDALLEKLTHSLPVTDDEDLEIRARVLDAIYRVSESSGHTPIRLHYLFWNLFRAICTREHPQCLVLSANCTLPSRYKDLFVRIAQGCPFSKVCASAGQSHPLREHVTETEYY